jgi:hypothetical protein
MTSETEVPCALGRNKPRLSFQIILLTMYSLHTHTHSHTHKPYKAYKEIGID